MIHSRHRNIVRASMLSKGRCPTRKNLSGDRVRHGDAASSISASRATAFAEAPYYVGTWGQVLIERRQGHALAHGPWLACRQSQRSGPGL